MKNADKIRQMSDEGLLKLLDGMSCACMCECYYDRWREWLGKRRTKRKPRRKNEAGKKKALH